MKLIHAVLLFGLIFLAACSKIQEEAKPEVDTILYNGKVVTLDSASTIASSTAALR